MRMPSGVIVSRSQSKNTRNTRRASGGAAGPQPLILPDGADPDADMRRNPKEPGESVEIVDSVGHDRIGSAIAAGADFGSASGHPAAQRRRQSAERHRRRVIVLKAELFFKAPGAPLDAGAGADIVTVAEPLPDPKAGADDAAGRVVDTRVPA